MGSEPHPKERDKLRLAAGRRQPDRHWDIVDPPIPPEVDMYYQVGKVRTFHRADSPWLEVETPEGAIAIWIRTGAVHPVTESGAVTDEPLDLPFPNEYPERVAQGHFPGDDEAMRLYREQRLTERGELP